MTGRSGKMTEKELALKAYLTASMIHTAKERNQDELIEMAGVFEKLKELNKYYDSTEIAAIIIHRNELAQILQITTA
jgi:GTP1/Obg family GTP-binding protein